MLAYIFIKLMKKEINGLFSGNLLFGFAMIDFSEKYLNIMRDKSSKPLECKISWCPTQHYNHDDDDFALLALYYVGYYLD